MKKKLDLNGPHIVGKYFEVNKDETEFAFPPRDYYVLEMSDSIESLGLIECNVKGCNNQVIVTENGNTTYAWYFLTNNGDKYAVVTIERRWIYEGKWRRDTVRHRLYPGEYKEVFSFPRNQNPLCSTIACSFEGK